MVSAYPCDYIRGHEPRAATGTRMEAHGLEWCTYRRHSMRPFFGGIFLVLMAARAHADDGSWLPGYGFPAYRSTIPGDLESWREKRTRDFWNRTSPFFGDPYYDPLKTSPFSPFRSPQYHPWRGSPFRGDPYYDPYAPRRDRLDYYNRRR